MKRIISAFILIGLCIGICAFAKELGVTVINTRECEAVIASCELDLIEKEIALLGSREKNRTQGAMISPAIAMKTGVSGARGVCSFVFAAANGEEETLFLLC